jgi:hypothetical protein
LRRKLNSKREWVWVTLEMLTKVTQGSRTQEVWRLMLSSAGRGQKKPRPEDLENP